MHVPKKLTILYAIIFISIAVPQATPKQPHDSQRNAPTTQQPITIPYDSLRKITLPNGMDILLFKYPCAPKVLVELTYKIGSAHENFGEQGIAHVLEHMFFAHDKTTAMVRKHGASYNAFTSMDVTGYHFEVNKYNWQPFLAILAQTMKHTNFDPHRFSSELKAVLHEFKISEDDPKRMVRDKVSELLYPANHPYHSPIMGYKEDFLTLTIEHLKNFHKKYYQPDNAMLFIMGDFDLDQGEQEARKHFEPLKSLQTSPALMFPQRNTTLTTYHTQWLLDVKKGFLEFYWEIPGTKDKDTILASAAACLLGQGQASRLHQALVEKQKVASSVSTYVAECAESGIFFIYVNPFPGKRNACKKIVQQELLTALQKGFSAEELTRMVKMKQTAFFEKLNNFVTFTKSWIKSYAATGDEFAMFKRVNHFNKLTSQELQNFIQKTCDPFLMHQIEVLPIPQRLYTKNQQIQKDEYLLEQKILNKQQTTPTTPEEKTALTSSITPFIPTMPKPDQRIVLNNGLTILLCKNQHSDLIHITCDFKKTPKGPFNLMMQLLIQSDKECDKKDFTAFFENHGASYSFDASGGSLSCINSDFHPLFNRFFHLLRYPSFSEAAITQKQRMQREDARQKKNNPKQYALSLLKKLLYGKNKTNKKHIPKITASQLTQLHHDYVVPNNMIISIVGKFNTEEIMHEIKKTLSTWQKQKLPTEPHPKKPRKRIQHMQPKKLDYFMTRNQVELLFGQPSSITMQHPDYLPLQLLNFIAFRSTGSRIFSLRKKYGLFYSASGGWATHASKQPGYDYIQTSVNPKTQEQAEKLIRQLITDLAHNGVTQDELDAARQWYIKKRIDSASTNQARAEMLCSLEKLNIGFDYYDKTLKNIQTLTVQDLNAVCKRYCSTDNMMLIRVGNIKKIKPQEQKHPRQELVCTRNFSYPRTSTDSLSDIFHGTRIRDPYRWLENLKTSETQKWLMQQALCTEDYLQGLPIRTSIKNRLTQLWNFPRYSEPQKAGDHYFFWKNEGLENRSALYMTNNLDQPPLKILDPNTLSKDGTIAITENYFPSKDGSLLAYLTSQQGSDWKELKIRNTTTQQDYNEILTWCKFTNIAWKDDNSGFYYNRFSPDGNPGNDLYWHTLGTPQSEDNLILKQDLHTRSRFRPIATDDGNYLVLQTKLATKPKTKIYVREMAHNGPFIKLLDKGDAKYEFIGSVGSIFYFLTDLKASHRRIIAINLNKPEPENWREIIAEKKDTLHDAFVFNNHLICAYLHDAYYHIKIYKLDGTYIRDILLPTMGTVTLSGSQSSHEFFIKFTSFLYPDTVFRYDFTTDTVSKLWNIVPTFDPSLYTTHQVLYPSKDGTLIPLFLTHKKDIPLHGTNPTIIFAYGGFGKNKTPFFSVPVINWLEQGGVYAVANIRGGGELGKEWHEAARCEKRQNSFDDFIAAAEWLIKNNYTQASKLAINGGCNGGLLVAACMTQRPELFGAVVCEVPVIDMLRYHKFKAGIYWTPEYGNAEKYAEHFNYLFAYSPLHNIKKGTIYPPTFVITWNSDDRTEPAHARKFIATLQAADAGKNPILLRQENGVGHGAERPVSQQINEARDSATFLISALKMYWKT